MKVDENQRKIDKIPHFYPRIRGAIGIVCACKLGHAVWSDGRIVGATPLSAPPGNSGRHSGQETVLDGFPTNNPPEGDRSEGF